MNHISPIQSSHTFSKNKSSHQDINSTESLLPSNFEVQLGKTKDDVSVFKEEESHWEKENQNKDFADTQAQKTLLSKQMQSDTAASQLFQNTQFIKHNIAEKTDHDVSSRIAGSKKNAFQAAVNKKIEASTAHIHAAAVPQGDPLVATQADSLSGIQTAGKDRTSFDSFQNLSLNQNDSNKMNTSAIKSDAKIDMNAAVMKQNVPNLAMTSNKEASKVTLMQTNSTRAQQAVRGTSSLKGKQSTDLESVNLLSTQSTKRQNKAEQIQTQLSSMQDVNKWEELADKVKIMTSSNKDKLTIQLKPEHLGRLDVNLLRETDGITAQLKASNEQAKGILDSNKQLIQQNLLDKGVQVKRVQVFLLPYAVAFDNKSNMTVKEDFNQSRIQKTTQKVTRSYEANKG